MGDISKYDPTSKKKKEGFNQHHGYCLTINPSQMGIDGAKHQMSLHVQYDHNFYVSAVDYDPVLVGIV